MTRILVVGPGRVFDEELIEAFEAEGMTVDQVADAMGAVSSLDRTQPDAVIAFEDLPEWTGLRLLRHVGSNHGELLSFLVTDGSSEGFLRAQQHDITPLVLGENPSQVVDLVADRVFEQTVEDHRDRRHHLAVATASILLESLDSLKRVSNYRRSTDLLRGTAIVSTSDLVEESICSKVTDVPGYTQAWVTHLDPETKVLRPHAAAGIDLSQLRDQHITDYTEAGVRLHKGSVDVRTGEKFGEAVVPLYEDDTLYGAIHVKSRGNGFSSFERQQLVDLGEIVSRFVTALEKLQDLASGEEAEDAASDEDHGDASDAVEAAIADVEEVASAESLDEETAEQVEDALEAESAADEADAEAPGEAVEADTEGESDAVEEVGEETTEEDEEDTAEEDEEETAAEDEEETTEDDSESEPTAAEDDEPATGDEVSEAEDHESAEEAAETDAAADLDPSSDELTRSTSERSGNETADIDHVGGRENTGQDADSMSPLVAYSDTIAHELRNHINVAEAFLDLGRTQEKPENFDRVEAALERIERLTDEAAAVASDSVNRDRIVRTDLSESARTAWERVEAEEGSMTVEENVTLLADPDLLELCLENLFRNAVDHVGRDVTLRVGPLADRDGIYVEDDGPGIPESQRDKLFGWGVSGGDSDGGIGLAIVDRIVHNHGWDIQITDGREGGARFEITSVEGMDG